METSTGVARDAYFSFREGVRGAEYLYLLMLFPVTSALLGVNLYHPSILLLASLTLYQVLVADDVSLSRSFALVMLLWTVFLLYITVSMFWSPSSSYAMSKFLRLGTICTLLLIAPTILFPETKQIYNFGKFAVYASLAVAVLIIIGYLSRDYVRPYALLGSLSHLAPGRIIGFGIVVTTYYVLASERRPRLATYGTMLGILLLGIVVSGSRGPLVAAMLATGTVVVLYLDVERDDRRLAALFLSASFLAAISLFVMHLFFGITVPNFDRIIPLLQGEFDPSNQRRLRFYRQGVLLWLESPLLGNGVGSYGVWIHGVDVEEYPHNIYLETLSELGVLGLLILGALLLVPFRAIVSNHGSHSLWVLLLGLFIYALLNASFSQDLQGNRMVYAAVGLALTFGIGTDDDVPND